MKTINEIYRHSLMTQALVLSLKKEIAQINDEEQRTAVELQYKDVCKAAEDLNIAAAEMWRCMQPEYIPFSTPE